MVRFHWHVEGGHCAFIPAGGISLDDQAGVRHFAVEMELAGQNETVSSLITVPAQYLEPGRIKPVGLVLAHGADADDWKGPLLSALAAHFARAGHVVMRYHCPQKEQRRQRIFEKALDAAVTSPFARGVTRWVLAGYNNGARIAASIGAKPRANVAGFALLAYPLLEPAPPPPKQKAGAPPPADSVGPLLKLGEQCKPILFINGEYDHICPGARLKEVCQQLAADCRSVVMQDLFYNFTAPGQNEVHPNTVRAILQHLHSFLAAVEVGPAGMAACALPRVAHMVPSTREPPCPPPSPPRVVAPPAPPSPPAPAPPPPPRPRAMMHMVQRGGAGLPGGVQQQQQGIPAGMIPVMGPNGQPMLISASQLAGNPAAAQQMMMLQQQMLVQLQKQQAAAAAGGSAQPAAAGLTPQMVQQMQLQMAMMQQRMAAAAAAARPAATAGMQQQPQQVLPPGQPQQVPLAVNPSLPPQL